MAGARPGFRGAPWLPKETSRFRGFELRATIGRLRVEGGVVVLGRAANLIVSESGLQTVDIIHWLNNKAIDSVRRWFPRTLGSRYSILSNFGADFYFPSGKGA